MGSEVSRMRMETPLRELLKANGTPLKTSTARKFLRTVETHAPWFLDEGLLNVPQWSHLGESLRTAERQNPLPTGTLAIWNLVQTCLISKTLKNHIAVKEGEELLEEIKEERSLASERGDKEEVDEMSGEELEELLQKMAGCDITRVQPSAPPPSTSPIPPPYRKQEVPDCCAIQQRGWKELFDLNAAFPIFEDQATHNRYHQPLDFKVVKQLKEATSQYGPQAPFTLAMVESMGSQYYAPDDWVSITRAVLSRGQYLLWKAAWHEICSDTARRNARAGNPHWNLDMLTGQGQYVGADNQIGFDPAVYMQIGSAAVKAWKQVPGPGDVQGHLSKIIQGPNEPYSDFVDRLIKTASRVFGDLDSAMPLVTQLAFEQANKWCQEAIRPWKNKRDLSTYIKLCRDVNDVVIQGQVLANAIVQGLQKGKRGNGAPGACFRCKQLGHMKKDCPLVQNQPRAPLRPKPNLCPRCSKGNHWASECRSMVDVYGQPIPPRQPKNGQRGPSPRGPQMYGVIQQIPRAYWPPTEQGTTVLKDETSEPQLNSY